LFRSRAISFDDWEAKARYLDGVAWADARLLPKVREVARRVARPHGSMSPEKMGAVARDLFRLVQHRVRYVADPASEEFSDAQQVLEQSQGDCDDKVRCFVALCRSLRIEAHVRPVMRQGEFVHVQAVCRWPGSDREPKALPGGWMVAEVILRDAELGDDIQDVPTRAIS
jgi:transglutaminase-like putative cysteine protease